MKRSPCAVFSWLIRGSTSASPSMTGTIRASAVVVSMVLAGALVAGCGGGAKATRDGGNDSAGTPASVTSCWAYCDMAIATQCTLPLYGSVAECRTAECADLATAPTQCQVPLRSYYDCERTQPDICEDSGCVTEAEAVINCNNASAVP